MTTYQLSIITPNGKIFDGKVNSLVAPGYKGSFGVMGRHAPMVVSLKPGPLTITHEGAKDFFALSPGVLEVNEQSDVLLLADFVLKAANIEEAKAQAQKLQGA